MHGRELVDSGGDASFGAGVSNDIDMASSSLSINPNTLSIPSSRANESQCIPTYTSYNHSYKEVARTAVHMNGSSSQGSS